MSSGKFLDRGNKKPHRCKKPINWFLIRFGSDARWKCECGKVYRWIYDSYARVHSWEYIWTDQGIDNRLAGR